MILKTLAFRNFGPYKTDQLVTFPHAISDNLMIVHGENMRGKTSFLNAIRWCLYGEAIGRGSRTIPFAEITNYDARARGDFQTTVTLAFSHDNLDWQLTRSMDRAALVADPRSNADYKVTISLVRDGSLVNETRITEEINRILPRDVSRFFLFDGELLQEYEELLNADSRSAAGIKSSIERILGIPALLRTRVELGPLLKRAQQLNANELKSLERAKDLSRAFDQETAKASSLEREVLELTIERDSVRDRKLELDGDVNAGEALLEAKVELEGARRDRDRLEKSRTDVTAEMQRVLGGAWADLLEPRVSASLRDLLTRKAQADTLRVRSVRLQQEASMIEATLKDGACSLCSLEIPEDHRSRLDAALHKAATEAADAAQEAESITEAQRGLSMPNIRPTGAAGQIRSLERQIAESDRNLYAVGLRITELQAMIAGRDTDVLAQKRRSRDRLGVELSRLDNEIIPAKTLELNEVNKKLRGLSRLMGAAADDAGRLRSTVEAKLYDELHTIFSNAIERFRERKRERVSERASNAFARLSTETTFQRLEINKNYGLQIIDRQGRYQTTRSAGAEQIVALSLIEALNAESLVQGPMIMDTPFGRLDQQHRTNVLEYSANLAPQVTFLVHSGEVSMEAIRAQFASRIGALYRIERISSSESTLFAEAL